jgi:hypothetical protein
MSLATVIRLEFAYPGVGVLAGDSLQYLSTATAHGVIMVFYMIMPAIVGAFGNFLLPTQLGVHDVAFPRLNSAAFWFLPGGLIMLCHLVCTDRRYARMNCFNIRELQSILKRKFFTDLVNTHDHRDLLEQSMIGLRYKTNNSLNLNSDVLSFYNFGINTSNLNKVLLFTNNTTNSKATTLNTYNYFFINFFNFNNNFFSFLPSSFYINTVCEYFSLLLSFNIFCFPFFTFNSLITTLFNNINFYIDLSYLSYLYKSCTNTSSTSNLNLEKKSFLVQDTVSSNDSLKNTFLESSSTTRYARFFNVLVNYDYKTGHYIGN